MYIPFVLRPFAGEADIPGVARLLAEVEAIDHEGAAVTADEFRASLERPDHDPTQDRWVVTAPGEPETVIGMGALFHAPGEPEAFGSIVAHPQWRRNGIARTMLLRMRDRLRQAGISQVTFYADTRNLAGNKFARRYGLHCVATYTHLTAPGSITASPPAWPNGFTLRALADLASDPRLLAHAFTACYEGLWGHRPVSEAEAAQWLPEFDPAGVLLLFTPEGEVAGMCRTEISAALSQKQGRKVGYIDAPGIIPRLRSLTLLMQMQHAALAWLAPHQPDVIEMESWGDDPATLATYGEMSFIIDRQANTYTGKLA